MSAAVHWREEAGIARDEGRPIVALESSVLAQGLPVPANREAAANSPSDSTGRTSSASSGVTASRRPRRATCP